MVDIYDDLKQNFKEEFFQTVETMARIKSQGPTFNNKFTSLGEKRKCRILEPPIREGDAFGQPLYSMMVVDTTDGNDSIPIRYTGTKFLPQQLLSGAISIGVYRNIDDISKDRKLRKLKGRALIAEAIPNTNPKAKKEFMLGITMNPEEDLLDVDTTIEELQKEDAPSSPESEAQKAKEAMGIKA